jgi:hypothetical protein
MSLSIPNVTVDQAREQLLPAPLAIADAFRAFKNERRAVYAMSIASKASVAAMVNPHVELIQ